MEQLERLLQEIKNPLETADAHGLLVEANEAIARVAAELVVDQRRLAGIYAARFPELIKLVRTPVEYAQAVQALGARGALAPRAEALRGMLPAQTALVIAVAASGATAGTPELDDAQWTLAETFVGQILGRNAARQTLLQFVEAQMRDAAPNVTALVGPAVAARLVSATGGVAALAAVPACNILVVGRQPRSSATGASAASGADSSHAGVVYQAPAVATLPRDVQRATARLLAAKVALAARLDAAKQSRDGSAGAEMAEDVRRKAERALEPPPGRSSKALPVPGEGYKKKRGGRRARALKARFAPTETSRAQNRVAFGVAEEEVVAFDESRGLGLLGQAGASGRLRGPAAESRTKVRLNSRRAQLSKMLNLPGDQLSAAPGGSGAAGTVSGLATSLSFTPVQGIELADPSQQRARAASANARWFSDRQFRAAGDSVD